MRLIGSFQTITIHGRSATMSSSVDGSWTSAGADDTGLSGYFDQPVAHREERRAGAGGDADLRVDVLDVAVGGLRRDLQLARDLLDRLAARDELEHVELARREAGDGGRGARRAVLERGEHGLDRLRVEPPGPDLGAELGLALLVAERGAMRARLAHRVGHVGGGEQAGLA